MVCDFQDPPEMIPQFIQKWSEGHKVVVGVKTGSNDASPMYMIRKFYYRMVNRLANIELIDNFTGFGIFVELSDIYVEGLVHVTSLKNDYYHFDAIKHRLIGESTKVSYRLGDKVRVAVMHVDLDERKIDLGLTK